ncbi:MAG TPA: YHS domain-containing protein [Bacteroidia bacterium]|nr:YHS domain-containing protein [Bacteroidia bacterium]HRC36307.1 YHS domain-containing protein [Bacteroidia bacterium]
MRKVIVALLILFTACQPKSSEPEQKTAPALEEKEFPAKPDIALASDIDPVCKMSVKEEFSDTAMYDGKIYGFCASACKEDFVKEPLTYLEEK